MSWLQTFAFIRRPPDARPMRVVDQEIVDELEFHLDMRTLDNVGAGMSADQARQDALRRFGDFERIHKACRQTLLGERIMLQRLQAILTLVLLVAIIFMGVALYRGQCANEAATAQMMEKLDKLAQKPALDKTAQGPAEVSFEGGPTVVQTTPRNGDNNVDPSLKEIRVTYNREMQTYSYAWCTDNMNTFPKKTDDPRYEADGRTCVLPVKLEPGKTYKIMLNTKEYLGFRDASGRPAVPYQLQFETRPATANMIETLGKIVAGSTVGQASNQEHAVNREHITFLADKLGLQGDKIVAVNGDPFGNFEDLLATWSRLKSEDGLRLSLRRDGKTVEAKLPAEAFQALLGPPVKPLGDGRFEVTFSYRPSKKPQSVYLAGTFNKWMPTAHQMDGPDHDGRFTTRLELPKGTYEYKFVLDGQTWEADPDNLWRTGLYNNSVLHVGIHP
jgi:RNA polymerase sigma-70 factor (ECF subfamily)